MRVQIVLDTFNTFTNSSTSEATGQNLKKAGCKQWRQDQANPEPTARWTGQQFIQPCTTVNTKGRFK